MMVDRRCRIADKGKSDSGYWINVMMADKRCSMLDKYKNTKSNIQMQNFGLTSKIMHIMWLCRFEKKEAFMRFSDFL